MLTPFYEKLHITDTVSVIIVSIALMLICGFAATRVTKRLRLPNVTAYIVAGILIGPYCLNLVPGNVIDGMDFIADIALAFIAFSTGEFFKFDTLKKAAQRSWSSRFLRRSSPRCWCLSSPFSCWDWS